MDEQSNAQAGQVIASAARTYEDFFVPALFGQWPDRILTASDLGPGDDVLDIGCGTGVLARAAARSLGANGSVTGVDVNNDMLTVASDTPEVVSWRCAPAEQLPFGDDSFDRVLSQFALMFFDDRPAAVAEMARVCRPGGSIAVATWADIERSPGYADMVRLLDRLFGPVAADALRAPFCIGEPDALIAATRASLRDTAVVELEGVARFESIDAWVHTDVRGWTLAEMIDDDQYAELLAAARVELTDHVQPDGSVHFAAPALLLTASP